MKVHRHLVDQIAIAVIEVFEQHRYADKVIEYHLKDQKKWGSRDRKFFAEGVYELVRWWRWLWYALEKSTGITSEYDGSGSADTRALDVEKVRLLWALWWSEKHELPDWEEFDVIYEARQNFDFERLASSAPRAVRESIPDWLDEYGEKELHGRWSHILHALNDKAHVYLRANTLKTHAASLASRLRLEEIDAHEVKPPAGVKKKLLSLGIVDEPPTLVLSERKNVFVTKAFKEGLFEVQDAASQFVAMLLNPQPGDRVVDACAGAGGKTLHIAALMKNKGRIVALDVHGWKLNELKTRARRNGVDIVETREIESTKVIKRMADSADRLLLDVPCSGLGVIRRNPDSKWKLHVQEINRLHNLQREILEKYSKITKVGGHMVYATCSILPSENEEQIRLFLAKCQEPGFGCRFELVGDLRLDPDVDGFDGFYAALLRRVE